MNDVAESDETMTTDRTDSLMDLLYGELSEEEEALLREELEDTPGLQAELDEYNEFLGELRSAMPVEEVPSSVHDSIMEAARAAAENPDARNVRRTTPEPEKQGIWRRLSGGQGSQIALVATVLLVSVFVARYLGPGMDAPTAGDISAVQEAAPAPQAMKSEAASEVEEEAGKLAEGDEMAPAEEPEATATAEVWDRDDEDVKDIARPLDEVGRTQRVAAARKAEEAATEEAAMDLPRVEEKAKPSPRKRSARRPKPTAKSTSTRSGPSADAMNYDDRNRADKKADGLEKMLDTDIFGGGVTGGEEEAQAPAAPPSADPAPQQREYRPAEESLSAVTQRWQANDYSGTIRAADDFLATGTGSRTDQARALQLKAQSLTRLGQYRSAERIYEQILKNYPGFRTTEINQARDEVTQKMRKRPKRKKKAAPNEAYEEDTPAALDSLD